MMGQPDSLQTSRCPGNRRMGVSKPGQSSAYQTASSVAGTVGNINIDNLQITYWRLEPFLDWKIFVMETFLQKFLTNITIFIDH